MKSNAGCQANTFEDELERHGIKLSGIPSTKFRVSPEGVIEHPSAIKRTEKAFDTLEMIVKQLKAAQDNHKKAIKVGQNK